MRRTHAQPAHTQDAVASKPAEAVYKNIVQLKGTPADQLMPAMQFISSSLGVQCDFCHVAGKMEADDKGAEEDRPRDDRHAGGHQQGRLPGPVAGDLLLLPPRSATSGELAAGAGFGCARAPGGTDAAPAPGAAAVTADQISKNM